MDRLLSMENHEFGGMVQIGSPIDEDMLRQAGIENCGMTWPPYAPKTTSTLWSARSRPRSSMYPAC
ncbi:MAG: hypothetical protein ACLU9S_04020 [Oscillospiraceae bacterium]